MSLTIEHTTTTFPNLHYAAMKEAVLGKRYALTLVFHTKAAGKKLNVLSRGKSYVPNVLSFPLDDKTGEIYITPQLAKTEAKAYGLTEDGYIAYLFIHGLLHLKGLDHGTAMDAAEARLLKRFSIK